MNKILIKGLVTVAVLGLAYYLSSPEKYRRLAAGLKDDIKDAADKTKRTLSKAGS